MNNIGIRTQDLFNLVNEQRKKNHQKVFENRAMAIIFSMAFTALTKEWIDFKKEFIGITDKQLNIIETICREKFNVELQGEIEPVALIAGHSPVYQTIKNTYQL
ncbi:hypothetical protein THII_3041 [Thioploca ingrica]|uniref:Uncharacterized protein n=1 Tax=Thioploca ingrica TaxID=40754 RepID=A0A090AGH8_9GAMM|nr:hypothetical protein THII_3041 [Thioploca ingrica]